MAPRKTEIAQRTFLAKKRFWMGTLRRALATSHPVFEISPHVKDAIMELNKLSFVYTNDSRGPLVYTKVSGDKFYEASNQERTISEARRQKTAFFRRAFVELSIDPAHHHSATFAASLHEWIKQFPHAKVIQVSNNFLVVSPGRGKGMLFEIKPREIELRLEKARNFMAEFKKFVENYRKTMKRKKT